MLCKDHSGDLQPVRNIMHLDTFLDMPLRIGF